MRKGEAIEAIATGAAIGMVAGLGGSAIGLLIASLVLDAPKFPATASPDAKTALGGIEVAKSMQSRSTGLKTARPSTEGR